MSEEVRVVSERSLLGQATPFILGTCALAFVLHLAFRFASFLSTRRKNNRLLKDFPGPKPHWLFGNLRQFKKGEGIYRQVENSGNFGGVYTTWIGPFWVYVMLAYSDWVQTILNKPVRKRRAVDSTEEMVRRFRGYIQYYPGSFISLHISNQSTVDKNDNYAFSEPKGETYFFISNHRPHGYQIEYDYHGTKELMILRHVRWSQKYGPAFHVPFGPAVSQVKLTAPDFIREILGPEPKDPIGYRFVKQWIGDGLLVSQGKKWARNRRLLTPSFHFDILKPYQDIFSNCANTMCNKWRGMVRDGNNSVEMFEHVSLMTLDSLMKCIFGIDSNFQNEKVRNPYIKCVYELSELITKRFRFFPYHIDWIYHLSWSGYKFRRAVRYTQNFTRSVIDKKKKEKENKTDVTQNQKYLDFLDMLLECKDADGRGLSLQEIQDEVDTFMFEGHDTTASGISWILYNLASHPEYQTRAREEVDQILGDRDTVTWNDVGQMEYLTMCVKESLRTHPPVPNIGRITTKPLTFPDGRSIPEGTWIGIAIYACHHNPKVWPDPEIYDPERFNAENSKDRHPHAFVPFSAGPRNCIGQHFAMNELKTCVAVVLKNFQLSVDEDKPAIKMPELVLRSKNGLYLKLTPIEK